MVDQNEDYAEYLFQQGRSGIAAAHEFRMLFTSESKAIHVFVEGDEDVLYYLPEIRRRSFDFDVNSYVCGGKLGVIEARSDIRSGGYETATCLYFVDRDYDDLFNCQIEIDEATYITDGYSIENDVVCNDIIDIILLDFARLSRSHPQFSVIKRSFFSSRKIFIKYIEPILGWCLAFRAGGGKPNFNNADLKKVIVVQSDEAGKRKRDGFRTFRKAVASEAAVIRGIEVRKWIRELRRLPENCRIRGKYELWFMEQFLVSALANVTAGKVGKKGPRVPNALRQHMLFEVLGGRFRPPPSLDDFLQRALT